MLGREGRRNGQWAGAARRTANEGTERVSTGQKAGRWRSWKRACVLRMGSESDAHEPRSHDSGQNKTNLCMIHKERVGIERREKGKKMDLLLIHLLEAVQAVAAKICRSRQY